MDVGPHDDISTFLLHIRRRAAEDAASSSHDVTVGSATGMDLDTDTVPGDDGATAMAAGTSAATEPRKRNRKRSRPTKHRDHSRMATHNAMREGGGTPVIGDGLSDDDNISP